MAGRAAANRHRLQLVLDRIEQLHGLAAGQLAGDTSRGIGASVGGVAAINYLYQVFKINKSLMMTKQEVKDEMKNSEGDPMVKAMRRQMARRLLQKQMLAAIPTAAGLWRTRAARRTTGCPHR